MIDISKFQKMSAYNNTLSNTSQDIILNQSRMEFDYYLKNSPTAKKIYVNDSKSYILGTINDVYDSEAETDTKWLLTSINNPVYMGDILTVNNRKWVCIYEKEKTVDNCNKVKIQRCNVCVKIPFFDVTDGKTPILYNADSIVLTSTVGTKETRQEFPTLTQNTFLLTRYDEYTSQLKIDDRLFVFNNVYQIVGIDNTNMDWYIKKGCINFALQPRFKGNDLDNMELGICDYYKYFPRTKTTGTPIVTKDFYISASSNQINKYSKISLVVNGVALGDTVNFSFDGDNLECYLSDITNNSCVLNSMSKIGFVKVKATLTSDNSKTDTIRIVVTS